MNYVLMTDSTTDYEYELLKEKGISVLRLSYNIDGLDFRDDMNPEAAVIFYGKMRAGATVKTSAVNIETFLSVWQGILAKGQDIIFLAFSSALSSTYNNAHTAAQELSSQFPDRRITVVDSKCASLGEGLLLKYMADMRDRGASYDEVVSWAEANKLHINHWFTVDDLTYLRRGGRISKAAAMVGSLLRIKPVLHMDDEGRLIPVQNVMGRKKAILSLVDQMEELAVEPGKQTVFISHGDCIDDALSLKQLITDRFGTKDFYINQVGPVIGSHSGPGTLALFFVGKNRG